MFVNNSRRYYCK